MDIDISKKEAYEIYNAVRESISPPTNPLLLSKAQVFFAKEGKPKMAACIAQWLVQVEGGDVGYETWRKLCEI
ncbi:MAG: hypothetical protein DRM98_00095 [Thermoplasmata archaeon]|nr:MAG: hypothetical protein DRM98_00095 [Thermoplasmata archaeon]